MKNNKITIKPGSQDWDEDTLREHLREEYGDEKSVDSELTLPMFLEGQVYELEAAAYYDGKYLYVDGGVEFEFFDVFGNPICVGPLVGDVILLDSELKDLVTQKVEVEELGDVKDLVREAADKLHLPIRAKVYQHVFVVLEDLYVRKAVFSGEVHADASPPSCRPRQLNGDLWALVVWFEDDHAWAPHPDTDGGYWRRAGKMLESHVCIHCGLRRTNVPQEGGGSTVLYEDEIREIEPIECHAI